ncbi:MAG: tetratricopeptide repeat protein [Elusimicrobia bacterium]|nr:tetratricopeptide repeat protein [Elusimicrobiota bacterium]
MRVVAALLLAALTARADLPSPSVERATAAVRAGDRKAAYALIAEARKLKQNDDDRERIALLYQDLKDFNESQALLETLIKERPAEPRLRLYLACVIAMAGDRESSLAALAEGEKLKPNAVDRQRMAFLHQDLKDYAPARVLLDGLIQENPRDLSVRLDRASLATQSGEKPVAFKQLAKAAELDPGPDDKRRMAAMYRDLGAFDRARSLLEQVPEKPQSLYDRAVLDARAGRRGAALASLAAAEKLKPSFEERRRMAALYLELRAFDEGFDCVAALIRDFPKHPSVRLDLAYLSARRGAREEALDALAEALRRNPDLQDRKRAALIYEDLSEHAKARELIDDLIREESRDPQLRIDRAYFAADTGDRATALFELAEAQRLKADPDDQKRIGLLYERLGANKPLTK